MLNQELKQRLIGAAVLIGVGILVIPSLLKWPPETASESAHETEREDYSELVRNSLAESGDSLHPQEKTRFVSAVGPGQDKPRPASLAESDANNVFSPQTSGEVSGWVIQIGSFARQENALRMRDRAISSGYEAFIEAVPKGTQVIYKVRIGPERDVNRAKELKQKLDRQLHTSAFLILSPND